MRRIQPEQLGLVPAFHDHVQSRELQAISRILAGSLTSTPKQRSGCIKTSSETMNVRSVANAVEKG